MKLQDKYRVNCWTNALAIVLVIVAMFIISGVLTLVSSGYEWLDAKGRLSHTEETSITVKGNWFDGESRICTSQPLMIEGKANGYAYGKLDCDDGPAHQMKITFWGRKHQPDHIAVLWKCIRKSDSFTCLQR